MSKKGLSCILVLIFITVFIVGCQSIQDSVNPVNSEHPTAMLHETYPDADGDPNTKPKPINPNDPTKSPTEPEKPKQEGTAPSTSGALSVKGTQLVDENGDPVQLRGVSTHGIAWYPEYINEKCFSELRNIWKANVVRLAMYTAEYGGYCNGGDRKHLEELIDNGVKYATNQDMYVIIDWHILSDGDPNTNIKSAKSFFDDMSEKYADHKNVIYEICNEPNGGTTWSSIKSYAKTIIEVIRNNDKDAVILVGTPNWSQYVDQAANDPITGYSNIMYTLHFYAATHTDSLRNTMTSAVEKGLPIFVSEYGICDASGSGAIDEVQANKWIETMDKYGISYVAWNLSNKAETSSVIKSDCDKVSGFTENDLSSSGKWLFNMLRNKNLVPNIPDIPSEPTESQTDGNFDEPAVTPSGKISYKAKLQNQWESNGAYFYQYNLTVINNSSSACSGWSISVAFNENIALSNSWSGNFSVSNGNTLNISSLDYNGNIPSGGNVGDIGFIISGGKNLKIISNPD